jgi:hypothetical protein
MKTLSKLFLCATLGFVCIATSASWQCTVDNPKQSQTWTGAGLTRTVAMQNAIGYCGRNTVFAKYCRVIGCFQR